jgi:septum formation protein
MRAVADMLILASSSPRRRALLRGAGIEFRVVAPRTDEVRAVTSRSYASLVRQAALRKAREVARRHAGPVLGADTIVVCAGEVMGKPRDEADARRMLRKLSGRWHSVYTGVALVQGRGCLSQAGDPTGSPVSRKSAASTLLGTRSRLRREPGDALAAAPRVGSERTEVAFRRLSRDEIERYLATGEPMDKAGAYAIQGRGAALVRSVRGCYTNVIGLPLPRVLEMLAAWPQDGRGRLPQDAPGVAHAPPGGRIIAGDAPAATPRER